jgi:hypothetical protein
MNFDEAFAFTDTIAGHFSRTNAEKLWEYASVCHGLMVEVGVLDGRSASLLLQAAETTGATVYLVDCWKWMKNHAVYTMQVVDVFPEVKKAILYMYSHDAVNHISHPISLLHIDGNHEEVGITMDCQLWLPRLAPYGVACFHDYGSPDFPGIKRAVDHFTTGWEDLGVWETLAIRRKPYEIGSTRHRSPHAAA